MGSRLSGADSYDLVNSCVTPGSIRIKVRHPVSSSPMQIASEIESQPFTFLNIGGVSEYVIPRCYPDVVRRTARTFGHLVFGSN